MASSLSHTWPIAFLQLTVEGVPMTRETRRLIRGHSCHGPTFITSGEVFQLQDSPLRLGSLKQASTGSLKKPHSPSVSNVSRGHFRARRQFLEIAQWLMGLNDFYFQRKVNSNCPRHCAKQLWPYSQGQNAWLLRAALAQLVLIVSTYNFIFCNF